MVARRYGWLALLALFLGVHAPGAQETTLRCGSRLVAIGDTTATVLEKCGEPTDRDHWEEGHGTVIFRWFDPTQERYTLPQMTRGPIQMERWTYDWGANRFIRHLYFENGRLMRIAVGDKGGR